MAAVNDKGSPIPSTIRLHLLLNYCRTVVRSDDTHLQVAMSEYERALTSTSRGS